MTKKLWNVNSAVEVVYDFLKCKSWIHSPYRYSSHFRMLYGIIFTLSLAPIRKLEHWYTCTEARSKLSIYNLYYYGSTTPTIAVESTCLINAWYVYKWSYKCNFIAVSWNVNLVLTRDLPHWNDIYSTLYCIQNGIQCWILKIQLRYAAVGNICKTKTF